MGRFKKTIPTGVLVKMSKLTDVAVSPKPIEAESIYLFEFIF